MPVQAEVFNHRVMMRWIRSVRRPVDKEDQDPHSDDHVQGVHSGHRKVKREEDGCLRGHVGRNQFLALLCTIVVEIEICAGNVVFDIFLVVLDALDSKEDAAQCQGRYQPKYEQLARTKSRAVNAHGHRQAGADEHGRIDGTERYID